MQTKTYPKAVVLKKSLVLVAVIGAILIVALIIHNIYQATRKHELTHVANNKIQTVANLSDINWYKTKKSEYTVKPQPNVNIQKAESKNKDQIKEENSVNIQIKQDLLKAMSTPISSNQIIAESESVAINAASNSSALLNRIAQAESDANPQAEKKIFLQTNNKEDDDYLNSYLKTPVSPYELQAGTIIPGILITGVNSDLPGQITGQVRSNVYDSVSGKHLLIPQGAKLTGLYDSQVAYGQERVLVVWKRIILPNGKSINLQGMPGVDLSGYAGFNDQVNNHYAKMFSSVFLMSVLGAGAQLSQPQNNSNNPFATPTVSQTIAQSLGTNIANTVSAITAKDINVQPTLEIRPGYRFNISVAKDIVFPGAYNR
jgi:type IV secretory pathway VirB10-like protein